VPVNKSEKISELNRKSGYHKDQMFHAEKEHDKKNYIFHGTRCVYYHQKAEKLRGNTFLKNQSLKEMFRNSHEHAVNDAKYMGR